MLTEGNLPGPSVVAAFSRNIIPIDVVPSCRRELGVMGVWQSIENVPGCTVIWGHLIHPTFRPSGDPTLFPVLPAASLPSAWCHCSCRNHSGTWGLVLIEV